jgi:hypothetical protein
LTLEIVNLLNILISIISVLFLAITKFDVAAKIDRIFLVRFLLFDLKSINIVNIWEHAAEEGWLSGGISDCVIFRFIQIDFHTGDIARVVVDC